MNEIRRPSREAAQLHLAQAATLLDEAARALARWGSEADEVVMGVAEYERANTIQPARTLEQRCAFAKEVGVMGRQAAMWAATLEEGRE